jgi:hypothetical protein
MSMAITYIYLDDEEPRTVRPYIDEVERHCGGLNISLHSPQVYQKQISALQKENYDGLILDLRLDQHANWEKTNGGEKAHYRGTTLAQEIRTRATEGKYRDCPIVLWSTDDRLKSSYYKDHTGHDLFDLKCVKEEIEKEDQANLIAIRLVSLVQGYEEIATIKGETRRSKSQFHRFLGFDEPLEFIDPRITSYFDSKVGSIPIHEYARFILRDLLDAPGPLIDERILAARLGIDITASKDFQKLKNTYLENAAYKGPFRDGWKRWWSYFVEDWWKSLENSPGPLRSIPARERVAFLKKVTRLKGLISAKPIKDDYSELFWTICQVSESPLDPRDGFVIYVKDYKLWQDKLYVSIEHALSGEMEEKGLIIDPLERERFKQVRVRSKA